MAKCIDDYFVRYWSVCEWNYASQLPVIYRHGEIRIARGFELGFGTARRYVVTLIRLSFSTVRELQLLLVLCVPDESLLMFDKQRKRYDPRVQFDVTNLRHSGFFLNIRRRLKFSRVRECHSHNGFRTVCFIFAPPNYGVAMLYN